MISLSFHFGFKTVPGFKEFRRIKIQTPKGARYKAPPGYQLLIDCLIMARISSPRYGFFCLHSNAGIGYADVDILFCRGSGKMLAQSVTRSCSTLHKNLAAVRHRVLRVDAEIEYGLIYETASRRKTTLRLRSKKSLLSERDAL